MIGTTSVTLTVTLTLTVLSRLQIIQVLIEVSELPNFLSKMAYRISSNKRPRRLLN